MSFFVRTWRFVIVCLAASLAARVTASVFLVALFVLFTFTTLPAVVPAFGQSAAPTAPNSDPTYQSLRNLSLGSEAVSVNNLDLKREAGTFHLRSGTVCFVAPVQGKVTGAVFMGDGNFVLEPPLEIERKSLKLLTKENQFSENFSHLVLRFTDSTYDEIKKASSAASAGCDAGLLKDSQNIMRHGHEMRDNLDARILADVLSLEPGHLFVAFVHGKRYNGKELFVVDPQGAPEVAPEEVELMTYDENKFGIWTAFHSAGIPKEHRGRVLQIEHQQLDTTIEKSGHLTGKATTTFVAHVNGLRAIPFDLFPSLRVQSVMAEGSQPLSFIQEDKNADSDYWVILPKPLSAGEKYSVTTTYSGKDAVSNEGGGNYFPSAREDWYPNTAFGEYATYDMTFHIPKGMKMAATGQLVSESNDGGQNVTVWKSEAPQTVAGFNFGRFKMEEGKLAKPEYLVQSFANQESPDWVQSLQHAASGDELPTQGLHTGPEVSLGTMSTTGLNKKALAEGELAVELYTDYFGPSSFKHLQVTQQTACNFGQSWPELVWIPTTSIPPYATSSAWTGATAATGKSLRPMRSLISGGDTPSVSAPTAISG